MIPLATRGNDGERDLLGKVLFANYANHAQKEVNRYWALQRDGKAHRFLETPRAEGEASEFEATAGAILQEKIKRLLTPEMIEKCVDRPELDCPARRVRRRQRARGTRGGARRVVDAEGPLRRRTGSLPFRLSFGLTNTVADG